MDTSYCLNGSFTPIIDALLLAPVLSQAVFYLWNMPFSPQSLKMYFFPSFAYKISLSPWNLFGSFRETKRVYYIPTQICIIACLCIPLFKWKYCWIFISLNTRMMFLCVRLYCFTFSIEINEKELASFLVRHTLIFVVLYKAPYWEICPRLYQKMPLLDLMPRFWEDSCRSFKQFRK